MKSKDAAALFTRLWYMCFDVIRSSFDFPLITTTHKPLFFFFDWCQKASGPYQISSLTPPALGSNVPGRAAVTPWVWTMRIKVLAPEVRPGPSTLSSFEADSPSPCSRTLPASMTHSDAKFFYSLVSSLHSALIACAVIKFITAPPFRWVVNVLRISFPCSRGLQRPNLIPF